MRRGSFPHTFFTSLPQISFCFRKELAARLAEIDLTSGQASTYSAYHTGSSLRSVRVVLMKKNLIRSAIQLYIHMCISSVQTVRLLHRF